MNAISQHHTATLSNLLAAACVVAGLGGAVACGSQTPTPAGPPPAVEEFVDAAMRGALSQVEDMLAAGADVDGLDADGRTALMYAAFEGYTAVTRTLLDAGATVDLRDPQGRPALMFAATGPFAETVELLLDRGADPQITDSGERFTALMHAASEGHVEVVEVLLRYGADAAMVDVDGDTALSFAQLNGHAAVVALLTAAPG